MSAALVLKSIVTYPVKSLPGLEAGSIELTADRGLPGDRAWALANGTRPVPTDGVWTACEAFERLTVRPAMGAWTVQLPVDSTKEAPVVRGPEGVRLGFGADGEASTALPEPFAPGTRLVNASDGYWDHADATISIVNLATVAELGHLSGTWLDPARFRANLYVHAGAREELAWLGRRVRLGDVELEVIRPIDRCRATSVRPGSSRSDVNVPAQLMRHAGHLFCGVYARVRRGGTLHTGTTGWLDGTVPPEVVRAAAAQDTAPPVASWPRSAQVLAVVPESEGVRSVWLADPLAHAGSLQDYQAGQHLRLHALNASSTWRAYTISALEGESVRVTVRRDHGQGSRALHRLDVGDRVSITGPTGALRLPKGPAPLVLITAGIGITPAVAMLRALVRTDPGRVVEIAHTARGDAALWDEVSDLVAALPHARAQLWTTTGAGQAGQGRPDLHARARSAAALGARVVVCGPAAFERAAHQALALAGLPPSSVTSETFASPDIAADLRPPRTTGPWTVRFARSGIDARWYPDQGTLLDLAETHGVTAPSHCRAGLCGTCRTSVRRGGVEQLAGGAGEKNSALTCCSVPASDLELDL